MNVKKLCVLGVLSGLTLSLWAAEAAIPPPVPLPGVRLGLSNIFILLTLRLYGRREAALVLGAKTVLGAAMAGTAMSFLYSLAGGVLAWCVMALLSPRVSPRMLWSLSAYAAVAHGLGQLGVARLLLGSSGVWWYLPALLIAGLIAGTFTGLCAGFALPHLRRILRLPEDRS